MIKTESCTSVNIMLTNILFILFCLYYSYCTCFAYTNMLFCEIKFWLLLSFTKIHFHFCLTPGFNSELHDFICGNALLSEYCTSLSSKQIYN